MKLLMKDRGSVAQTLAIIIACVFLVILGLKESQAQVQGLFWAGIFGALIFAALPLAVRAAGRRIWGSAWNFRYVSWTAYVTLVGLVIFMITIGVLSPTLEILQHQLWDKWWAIRGWTHPELSASIQRLENLATFAWVLEQFPLFVILPGSLAFLAGYSLDRSKHPIKQDSVSTLNGGAEFFSAPRTRQSLVQTPINRPTSTAPGSITLAHPERTQSTGETAEVSTVLRLPDVSQSVRLQTEIIKPASHQTIKLKKAKPH